jgi:ADP-L-glycero-D-manno-heptose 6-epimerase
MNREGIDNIVAVDHLSVSEKWKNLRALSYADYCERDDFWERYDNDEEFWNSLAGIIHMGACSATTEKDATYLARNNFGFTCRIAEKALKHNIRFLYASSCATYGDGSNGWADDVDTIEKLRPLNMYGYSKQMFDLYAKRRGWLDKFVGCKFSNVYGPNELHKNDMRSVVCRAYEQITASGTLKLFKSYRPEYADGEQLRDFLYVKDAADIVWYLFCNREAAGLFNVGSGRAESWNALARAAFAALDKPLNIEYIEMPETLKGKYQYYTCAELDRLRSVGYTREAMSLDEAVKDYYSYRLRDAFLGDE